MYGQQKLTRAHFPTHTCHDSCGSETLRACADQYTIFGNGEMSPSLPILRACAYRKHVPPTSTVNREIGHVDLFHTESVQDVSEARSSFYASQHYMYLKGKETQNLS